MLKKILLIILFYWIVTVLIMIFGSNNTDFVKTKNVIIIVAHPDDEISFFTPTILNLLSNKNINLQIISLSNGNYKEFGEEREKEFLNLTNYLGIKSYIVNHSELQDGKLKRWDPEVISEVLDSIIVNKNDLTLITFDNNGVYYHSNHMDTSDGVRNFSTKYNLNCLFLSTKNILRTSAGVFDILPTFIFNKNVSIIPYNYKNYSLFLFDKFYKTQDSVKSKCIIIFSRYNYVNDYI